MNDAETTARVGMAGWFYPKWRGTFYPPGLVQRRELEYAAEHLDSIEINATFRGPQSPTSFLRWRERTPDDFVFAVKGSREITHVHRLRNVRAQVADFFASGVLALQEKLGPILWQTPPQLQFQPDSFRTFMADLPHSVDEARHLARSTQLPTDSTWTSATVDRPVRHAIEVRHASFLTQEFLDILYQYDIAAVFTDTATRWPRIRQLTSDHVYVRMQGDTALYSDGYSDAALDDCARAVEGWLGGAGDGIPRDTHVYFVNDDKVLSPRDAMRFRERVHRA